MNKTSLKLLSRRQFIQGQSNHSNFCRNSGFARILRRITVVPTRQMKVMREAKLRVLGETYLRPQFSLIWPILKSKPYYVTTSSHTLRIAGMLRQGNLPSPLGKYTSTLSYLNSWSSSIQLVKWYDYCLKLLQLEYWQLAANLKLKRFSHQLRFRFINSRLTLLLTNPQTRSDYFFVSAGLFTRYFFFQKSVKRSKVLKLVMSRFARKMLILLGLKDLTLVIRGLPFMLEQLIEMLLSSLRHPFTNTLTGELFDEVKTAGKSLHIGSLIFVNIKPFGFMKTRLKGRIKRKIRRRIHRASRADY